MALSQTAGDARRRRTGTLGRDRHFTVDLLVYAAPPKARTAGNGDCRWATGSHLPPRSRQRPRGSAPGRAHAWCRAQRAQPAPNCWGRNFTRSADFDGPIDSKSVSTNVPSAARREIDQRSLAAASCLASPPTSAAQAVPIRLLRHPGPPPCFKAWPAARRPPRILIAGADGLRHAAPTDLDREGIAEPRKWTRHGHHCCSAPKEPVFEGRHVRALIAAAGLQTQCQEGTAARMASGTGRQSTASMRFLALAKNSGPCRHGSVAGAGGWRAGRSRTQGSGPRDP